MIHLYILCSFLFLMNVQGADVGGKSSKQPTQQDMNTLQGLTSFAKNALISNTKLAKDEFGIKDEQDNKDTSSDIIPEDQYKTGAYRDIFFTVKESALINQALDYYKQGKQMSIQSKQYKVTKIEHVRQPLIKLSSIIYNNGRAWSTFTSAGKFNDHDYKRGNIEITGVSKDEVEFVLLLPDYVKPHIESNDQNDRLAIENGKLVITLRTGECVFAEDLVITKSCNSTTEMIDKEIEVIQQ